MNRWTSIDEETFTGYLEGCDYLYGAEIHALKTAMDELNQRRVPFSFVWRSGGQCDYVALMGAPGVGLLAVQPIA